MSADLTDEGALAVARVLFDIHQRRAAREAAEQESQVASNPAPDDDDAS